jgi:hypothetical protein
MDDHPRICQEGFGCICRDPDPVPTEPELPPAWLDQVLAGAVIVAFVLMVVFMFRWTHR